MDDPRSKRCRTCKNVLPLSEFARDRKRPGGLSTQCRQCAWQYYRRYRTEKREHIAGLLRKRGLALKYRLTPAQWETMLASQGGKCAICRRDFDATAPTRNVMVDHEHTTGGVRALLCRQCNTMIGMAGEDVEVLQAAIEYLEQWSSI